MNYLYTIALNHLYLLSECDTSTCLPADNKICNDAKECVCDAENGFEEQGGKCVEKSKLEKLH